MQRTIAVLSRKYRGTPSYSRTAPTWDVSLGSGGSVQWCQEALADSTKPSKCYT